MAPDQEVVVTRFPPVKKGQSVRLRLSETYTAPQSYRLDGDELVFDRSFGRPRNAVVLPRGWYLTWLSIPAGVRRTGLGLEGDSRSVVEAVRANAARLRALREAVRGHEPELILAFEAETNVLTLDAWDPKSGTAEFKATAIRVDKLDPGPAAPEEDHAEVGT